MQKVPTLLPRIIVAVFCALLFAAGKYADACPLQSQVQGQAEAFLRAGHRSYDTRAYTEGVNYYSRAIKLNPKLALAYACRGDCHRDLGDLKLAVSDYDQALKLSPNDAFVLGLRGECKYKLGDNPAAVSDLGAAKQTGPPYFFVYLTSAQAKVHTADASGALRDCQRASDLCSVKDDSRLSLVRLSANLQLGNFLAALADILPAFSRWPRQ